MQSRFPDGASLILTHGLDGELKGLKAFGDKHPPVAPVFFAFRVMVGVGLLMLAVSWTGMLVSVQAARVPALAAVRVCRDDVLGLDRHLGGLAGHRNRPPALSGLRRDAHRRGRIERAGGTTFALTLIGYLIVYVLLLISYLVVVTQFGAQCGWWRTENPGIR